MEQLSDLPIDDTWIMVGIFILAVAAFSHLVGMWKEARRGIGDGESSPDGYDAEKYFAAWRTAGDKLGLKPVPTDGELRAPQLRGELRGLPATVEMELQRSGRRRPDPQALNPATLRCPIVASVELPFPWKAMTVREFIRADSTNKEGCDQLSYSTALPEGVVLRCGRLDRQARRVLTEMVDTFKKVTIIDGKLNVEESIHPSRNTSQWKASFATLLQEIRGKARLLANTGLCVEFERAHSEAVMVLRMDPDSGFDRQRCRAEVSLNIEALPDNKTLQPRMESLGIAIEKREHSEGKVLLKVVITGGERDAIAALTQALLAP